MQPLVTALMPGPPQPQPESGRPLGSLQAPSASGGGSLDEHSVPIKRQGAQGSLRQQGRQGWLRLKRTQGWLSMKRAGVAQPETCTGLAQA